MKLLGLLEKRLGRYAPHNITIYLIAGQTLFYVLYMMGKIDRGQTWLSADLLLRGEWWRLVTFPFDPPVSNPLFAFFAWYLFYLMGSALEALWGAFRYNLFLATGYVLTVAVSFFTPELPVGNAFIGASVFLAFAWLFPDFQLLLFFVLPVRVKWLALLTWLGYLYLLIFGDWQSRLLMLASVGGFLLFFARDIMVTLRYGGRRMAVKASRAAGRDSGYFHRCAVCGITDRSHPDMDFRYCPDCDGQYGYCREHIFNHDHVKG